MLVPALAVLFVALGALIGESLHGHAACICQQYVAAVTSSYEFVLVVCVGK